MTRRKSVSGSDRHQFPLDPIASLPRAAPRQEVPEHPEREIVADEVWSRHENERAGEDHQQRVDHQPEAVAIADRG